MVDHFGIDHVGSCFPKEVFDPKKLPEEDYYDRYTALVSPTPDGTSSGTWPIHANVVTCGPIFSRQVSNNGTLCVNVEGCNRSGPIIQWVTAHYSCSISWYLIAFQP